jgi:hypothetical protein
MAGTVRKRWVTRGADGVRTTVGTPWDDYFVWAETLGIPRAFLADREQPNDDFREPLALFVKLEIDRKNKKCKPTLPAK